MGKSRYSKTKAAGQLVGLTREGKNYRQQARLVPVENRKIRRTRERG